MPKISSITCHKILNSRGDWTIETHVKLDDGSEGSQAIPEGASKGLNEAVSISVDKAIKVVTSVINDALLDEDPYNQESIDNLLISMDGTPNKKHLGGNSILSVSLAVCSAAAQSRGLELYEYLSILYSSEKLNLKKAKFPTPVFNVLNGGKHAHNGLSFQEFMVIPSQKTSYPKALEMGTNIYHSLKKLLEDKGYDTAVGDEGGFAPDGLTPFKALELVRSASEKNYRPGSDVFFGMDVAAESFYRDDMYNINEDHFAGDRDEMMDYYQKLIKSFELIYIEDPFFESDYQAWSNFYKKYKGKFMIVGDDLVTTNPKILKKVLEKKLISAVIIKPNQIGTLTETLKFVKDAKDAGLSIVVSHRSGDTAEDTFISDLALGVGADFLKAGAPDRGERVAKYNRLLDIFAGD